MRRTLALVALFTALALTGCGGAASVGGGPKYPDTKALADALGCGGTHKLDGPETIPFGAKETASCDPYTLAVFRDDEARDLFVKSVGALGGSFAVGDGWAVASQTVAGAKTAAEKLGGKTV